MSFLQRCMLENSKESLMQAAAILNDSPEAMRTFNRLTGEGCYKTAIDLRKPNVMKLLMNTVVDGTLSNSMITTIMPIDVIFMLKDTVENHSQEFTTEILTKMEFILVQNLGDGR